MFFLSSLHLLQLHPRTELYEHFKAVAEAVPNMPIVLYNIPARTGNVIAPDTVGRLAEIDNIVGAKDSSGNSTIFLNISQRQTRTSVFYPVTMH